MITLFGEPQAFIDGVLKVIDKALYPDGESRPLESLLEHEHIMPWHIDVFERGYIVDINIDNAEVVSVAIVTEKSHGNGIFDEAWPFDRNAVSTESVHHLLGRMICSVTMHDEELEPLSIMSFFH